MTFQSIESVLILILMMAIGFVITKQSWFGKSGENFLSKFCIRVAIPCNMVVNVSSNCETREELLDMLKLFPVPFGIIAVFLIFGYVMSKLLRVEKKHQGTFINVMAFSNTVIVGFPIVTGLFGEPALPTAMSYYIANTVMFWSIGAWLLRRDGGQTGKLISLNSIKKMLSLPLLGFLFGAVLVLLGIKLPQWIFSPLSQIGKTATPLAMIVTGSVLRYINFKELKLTKDVIVLLLNRFLLSPVLLLILCIFLPFDTMTKQVYLIMTVMPAMTQFGIVARESGADYEFATVLIAVTTIVSMIAIPIYSIIMGFIF